MSRSFRLSGNHDAKFKKLEELLPRIMSHMSTKTYGVIPSSIVAFYKETVQPGEIIFKCGMFKGKLLKLLFLLDQPESKAEPEYILTLSMGMEDRVIKVNTKKLSHIMNVDIDIPDGAEIEVRQITSEVVLKNVHVTALIEFDQNINTVKEFVTEQLLEGLENEGI